MYIDFTVASLLKISMFNLYSYRVLCCCFSRWLLCSLICRHLTQQQLLLVSWMQLSTSGTLTTYHQHHEYRLWRWLAVYLTHITCCFILLYGLHITCTLQQCLRCWLHLIDSLFDDEHVQIHGLHVAEQSAFNLMNNTIINYLHVFMCACTLYLDQT